MTTSQEKLRELENDLAALIDAKGDAYINKNGEQSNLEMKYSYMLGMYQSLMSYCISNSDSESAASTTRRWMEHMKR